MNKAILLSFHTAALRLLDSWSLGKSLSLASLEKSKCKTSLPHISSQEALFMPRLPVCFWWLRSTCLWRCPFLSVLSPLTHTSSFRWIIRWLEAVLLKGTNGGRKYRETHMQQKKGTSVNALLMDPSLWLAACLAGGLQDHVLGGSHKPLHDCTRNADLGPAWCGREGSCDGNISSGSCLGASLKPQCANIPFGRARKSQVQEQELSRVVFYGQTQWCVIRV